MPGEESEVEGDDFGPAAEPVEMMDYLASIAYRNPKYPRRSDLVVDASRCSTASSGSAAPRMRQDICVGGRGICPIDSLELDEQHLVDLPQTGTITNFVVVTPVQYPGQTETEPFARVFVLLDGTDVVLSYQPVVELPVHDVAGRCSGEARCGRPRPRRPRATHTGA